MKPTPRSQALDSNARGTVRSGALFALLALAAALALVARLLFLPPEDGPQSAPPAERGDAAPPRAASAAAEVPDVATRESAAVAAPQLPPHLIPRPAAPSRAADGTELHTLFGRVLDATTRQPVSPYQMWCARVDEGSIEAIATRKEHFQLAANGLGTFTWNSLPEGDYNLLVRIEGYEELIAPAVHVPQEEPVLELLLSRGAYIQGIVRDQEGTGVQGIEVRLEPEQLDDPTKAPGARLKFTQADGSYLFSNLPAGRYQVRLGNVGLADQHAQYLYIGAGSKYPAADFVIPELNTVAVAVRTAGGEPIKGAHVRLLSDSAAGGMFRGESQGDGTARIEYVPAGSYRVKVWRGGFLRHDSATVVVDSFEPQSLEVTLEVDPRWADGGVEATEWTQEQLERLKAGERPSEVFRKKGR